MSARPLVLLPLLLLAACAGKDKPSRTYADLPKPPMAQPQAGPQPPAPAPQPQPGTFRPTGVTGLAAVREANSAGLIEPSSDEMDGSTWVLKVDSCRTPFLLPLSGRKITTITFPAGETISKVNTSDVAHYGTVVGEVDDRAALTIHPVEAVRGADFHVVTSGCVYHFRARIVQPPDALEAMELERAGRPAAQPTVARATAPAGAFNKLRFTVPDGSQAPPWAEGAAGFADQDHGVICLKAPLPEVPTLLAGTQGNVVVDFHVVASGDKSCLTTTSRITEGLLVMGPERLAFTAGE